MMPYLRNDATSARVLGKLDDINGEAADTDAAAIARHINATRVTEIVPRKVMLVAPEPDDGTTTEKLRKLLGRAEVLGLERGPVLVVREDDDTTAVGGISQTDDVLEPSDNGLGLLVIRRVDALGVVRVVTSVETDNAPKRRVERAVTALLTEGLARGGVLDAAAGQLVVVVAETARVHLVVALKKHTST